MLQSEQLHEKNGETGCIVGLLVSGFSNFFRVFNSSIYGLVFYLINFSWKTLL